jgi:hypothetical protein
MSLGYVAILVVVTIVGAITWKNVRRKNLERLLSEADTCFESEHTCPRCCNESCDCGPDPHELEDSLVKKCYKGNSIV